MGKEVKNGIVCQPLPADHPLEVPEPALDHLIRLTDDTGLFQHAKFTVPNRAHGYCTDDNARGAIAMVRHYSRYHDPRALKLLDTYLAFLMHAQNPDGSIRNFLEFSRRWWEDEPAHDGFGRALWALGTVLANPPAPAYLSVMKDCFDRATGHIQHQSNRGLAYCIFGLCEYLKRFPGVDDIRHHVDLAAGRLVAHYRRARGFGHTPGLSGKIEPLRDRSSSCESADPAPQVAGPQPNPHRVDWEWFEDSLTYDNAVLPHALFLAGLALGTDEYLEVAQETGDFLLETTWNGDHFSFIGTRGWYEQGKARATFDQQPVEAGATVLMLRAAYDATGKTRFLRLQRRAFDWFLGVNDLGIPLYDKCTKGCSDGLMSTGINGNQGAESMLSFLLSVLSVLESQPAFDKIRGPNPTHPPVANRHDGRTAGWVEVGTATDRSDAKNPIGKPR